MLQFFWVCLFLAVPLIAICQPAKNNRVNWLKFKGKIQAQQTLKYRSGSSWQYGHQLQAALDFNIWQVKLPFSLIYVDQNISYQHPFRRFRLAPKYKWFRLQIGNQAHNLSSYSLNGKPINGIGITLKPPKSISLSIVYGKIEPAISPFSDTTNQMPDLKAAAIKLGFNRRRDHYELIYFQSFASENLHYYHQSPLNNTIVETRISKTLASKLSLKADLAWSRVVTIPGQDAAFKHQHFKSGFGTVNALAMNYQLDYRLPKVIVGLQMERIAPEFQSAGLVNQNPDLQSITTNTSIILPHQKIRINSRVGIQQDNLKQQKIKTTTRIAARFSLQWRSSKNWICNINWSNIIQQIQPQHLLSDWQLTGDTIQLRQINSQGNFNVRKVIKKQTRSGSNQQFSVFSSIQQAHRVEGTGHESFYLKSEYQWNSRHIRFALYTAYNRNSYQQVVDNFFTPGLKISAKREKIQWNFQSGSTWNFKSQSQNRIRFNHRLNLSYPVNEHQKLLGSLMAITSPGDQNNPFQVSTRISYQYQF